MNEKILVIEDDQEILRFLQRALVFEGYRVDLAAGGTLGLTLAHDGDPALIILDLLLPDLDGLEVCRRLRLFTKTPIIMVTAKDKISDKVNGLDAGADDYLVKPFGIEELLARVRAQLRRTAEERPEVLSFSDLTLDHKTHQAMRGDRLIDLTAKEFNLLDLFLHYPNQVLTRALIFEKVWEYDFGGESNVLDVYIRYLREKLEANSEPRLIHTIRGVGYVLREPD